MALHSSFFPHTLSISHRPHLISSLFPGRRTIRQSLFLARSLDGGAGNAGSSASSVAVVEDKAEDKKEASATSQVVVEENKKVALGSNGAVAAKKEEASPAFSDSRWVGGTWDLTQFGKDGKIDWDAVIDAEVRRRKWLEDNPEASSDDEPVTFDTSVIPWWSWVKRFHLPEAELLNGRAAMIGFFMAYFVDSLTGAGLVDQMGNFFCKTLLLVAVAGVLLVRRNEDVENLKKLLDETSFYDKQWQATWQDNNTGSNSSKS